jgi:hypothetical protein
MADLPKNAEAKRRGFVESLLRTGKGAAWRVTLPDAEDEDV